MADLFSNYGEDSVNSDEGLGSSSEGMSGDAEDDICDDPSSVLDDICQGARLDLLEEHQHSDNPYHRQAVVRTLQSSLRAVGGAREEAERLLCVATLLSQDVVEDIRCDVADQIPHLALACHTAHEPDGRTLDPLISSHILPIITTLLGDPNKMIHKTAQGALLALLEQGLLPSRVVEEKLVPLVVSWCSVDDAELNTSAIGLMTKMACVIGRDSTIHHFLQPFTELCEDSQLYVRKVCATNFGDFAAVFGPIKTEEMLLVSFLHLCQDNEWAVRKACAEVFTTVSHAVTLSKRKSTLASTFHQLLRDESRWVQVASFQSLGSFIATFSGQDVASHDHQVLLDTEGVVLALRAEANCKSMMLYAPRNETLNLVGHDEEEIDTGEDEIIEHAEEVSEEEEEEAAKAEQLKEASNTANLLLNSIASEVENMKLTEKRPVDSEESFNTFQFWRTPLPELGLSKNLMPPPLPTTDPPSLRNCGFYNNNITPPLSPLVSLMPDHLENQARPLVTSIDSDFHEGSADQDSFERVSHCEGFKQEIVPPMLINHFVYMATPLARTVDNEISHHCAFSLPAVVLTLGRNNWPLLRKTYQSLALDMQWKVRRTMASSIHEIAAILGEDLASTDLMPIFMEFVKDLDEVRIGVLKHLTSFLKILRHDECEKFLPELSRLLQMDHHTNWRYREELATQLIGVLDLCTPEHARSHVAPIALALLDDRVAAVREAALPLVAKVTATLSEEQELLDRLLARYQELYVATERWMRRQSLSLLCGHLIRLPNPPIKPEIFATRILPMLEHLAKDSVPNVRLAVAKSISQDVLAHPYFAVNGAGFDLVEGILHDLQLDRDKDVRYFSGGMLETSYELTSMMPLSEDSTIDQKDDQEHKCWTEVNS
ncbi:serine/threonine-protein phosphatase 4 regulatory subunit 1-like isoform X2 [Neocloeon triangulifer]|uniref:serine/threonine-protein phosphatase 4 regulatory subunit 1-like isoform X2 n=1 Tax=Neocloeon triangulifer TaxID=2078957 RepID=UPI00286ECFC4|nr:serine/threonine-protein phosphatase 4 regulatory subunit 1-like isoform X2 [Neocloeon triangulifer]